MNYRLDKQLLLDTLSQWNRFLKRRVHLIACGGTAMTLLGVKPSTKDVDFMIPSLREYGYLIGRLQELGYQPVTGNGWKRDGEAFQFDLFPGNKIHTTKLLASPLEEGGHTLLQEYSHLYIGILNDYDLISSKLMRGTKVDFEDCLVLARAHKEEIDIEYLEQHFLELISYDVGVDRLRPHIDHFLQLLRDREV